jgi:tetratricopeptide (TPR) repeat protein
VARTGGALLGRERELAALDALLDTVADGIGGALVITGDPGSGKSALIAEAVGRARARNLAVHAARADERDRVAAFGVVRELFESVAGGEQLLSGPAGAAAPAFDLVPPARPGTQGDSVAQVVNGLDRLVATLSQHEPMLVAVDDAHWADAPSLRFLERFARRVEELPVALVVGLGDGDAAARDALLSAIPAQLVLSPCEDTAEPAPGSELVPLAHHGSAEVALAQAVAVLGRDAELGAAAAVAGLDLPEARRAATALAAGGVLEGGERLRFVNSAVQAAVYADIGRAQRSDGHRRAARLLEAGAPDRAIGHLLAAEPAGDPWVVERLQAGAERALARGSSEIARTLLERAREEAATGDDRARVLLALGQLERSVNDAGSVAELENALALATSPDLRAEIVRALVDARLVRGDGEAARSLLEWAKRELPDPSSESWLVLEASRVAMLQLPASAAESAALVGRLARVESERDDTPAQRRLLALLAFHRFIWGQTTAAEVARLADRALAGGRLIEESGLSHASVAALSVLQGLERDREVESHLEAAAAVALRRGLAAEPAIEHVLRGRLALFRGRLPDAEADLRAALALNESLGLRVTSEFALAALVNVLVERGDLDGADAVLDERRFPAEGSGNRYLLLQARAALRRAQGRTAEAAADVRAADRHRTGPAGASILSRTMLALSTHAAGGVEQARQIAADAVERAERWGVAGQLGLALRTQGLVEEPERGLRLLDRAEAILAGTPRRLEHARALLELGAARRRAGHTAPAREALEAGRELAQLCSATPLAERAHDELVACGAPSSEHAAT